MKKAVVVGLAGIFVLSAGADWRVAGFPNQVFSEAVVEKTVTDGGKPIDVNYWFIDAQRTGRKFSRTGTSLAFGATATVERAGDWRFRVRRGAKDGFAYELYANGVRVADFPDGVVLARGTVRLELFARLCEGAHPTLDFALEGCVPGAADFAPVKTVAADPPRVPAPYATPFRLADAQHIRFGWRTFKLKVDEPGLYDFAIQMPGRICYIIRAYLDDLELLCVNSPGAGGHNAFFGPEDRTGDRYRQRLDFFGRYHARRWLEKGEYELHYFVHIGADFATDEMDTAFPKYPLGYTRLAGRERLRETAFYPEGRDAMVFAQGEPLKVRAQSAWRGEPLACTFRVRREGGGETVYEERLAVDAAARHFTYPCDREGAFEYTVEADGFGVLEGPWAFAVVGAPTDGTSVGPGMVVDSVVCAETSHRFRDNGTSFVVTNAEGVVYRKTGPMGFVKRAFAEVKRPWKSSLVRPAEKGEKGRMYYGCDWYAYTLTVRHPGRTHVVRCTVPNDAPRLVTALAVDWTTGAQAGWNMVAGEAPQAGKTGAFSFFVWPNTNALDVLVINSRGCHGLMQDRAGAVEKIELVEYPDGLPPLESVGGRAWNASAEVGWAGEQVNIGPNERTMPPLGMAGRLKCPDARREEGRSWGDFLLSWERFGEVSEHLGHNWHCYPSVSYGMTLFQGPARLMIPQGADVYAPASGEIVDLFDRDIMALMVLKCTQHGMRYCADFMVQKCYEGLRDCWARESGRSAEGMFLSRESDGKMFKTYSAATFPNPAHPVARRQIVRFYEAVAKRYGRYAGFGGIRTRFWEEWPGGMEGWFYDDTLGYDDWTVARFAAERGLDLAAVGTNRTAFAARRRRLQTEFADAWYAWRTEKCVTLREEILSAVRRWAPQAALYTATAPDTHKKATGLDPTVIGDRRELGFTRRTATTRDYYGVEWNRPDPIVFANFDVRPDPFAGDVAPSGTWHVITAYLSGFCETGTSRIPPYNREAAALALAENRLDQLTVGGQWSLPSTDEGLRAFVRVWRSIPDRTTWRRLEVPGGAFAPIALWFDPADGTFWIVNRTDRPRTVDVAFASGARRAVTVAAFMPALETGDGAVVAATVRFGGEEIAELKRHLGEIRALGPYARTTDEAADFAALLAPLEAAAQKGDWASLRIGTLDFRANHRRWFEICGWPADFCVVRHDIGYQACGDGYRDMYKNFDEGTVETRPEDYRKFLAFPRLKTMKYYKHGLGNGKWFEIQVTGIFGGGYGDIRVTREGKELGVIRASGATPRLETRILPVKVQSPGNGLAFELTGLGEKGMCLLHCGAREVSGTFECTPRKP